MRKIILALVILSLVAMPAFASVQNIKVSGSIDSSYVSRTNFDLQDGLFGTERNKASFFMTQTGLKIDADLTDNVSTTVALINERAWGQSSSALAEGVDLNLAFVTLKEMLYSPLTVVIGRQAFKYGNSFIFDTGALSSNNSGIPAIVSDLSKQTGLDAIRAILDYSPLKLEMFYGKYISNATIPDVSPANNSDVDLMGINATYDFGDEKKSQVEGYLFVANNKFDNDIEAKAARTYVPGVRVSTNLLDSLYTSLEYAHQTGRVDYLPTVANTNSEISANAVQFIAVYQVPVAEKYMPVLSYDYTFTSGDKGPGVKKYWYPAYENQNSGKIYDFWFSPYNSHVNCLALQVNPMEDVTTKLSWTNLKLDKGSAGWLTPLGSTLTNNKNLGNEIDLDVKYAYTEDVTIGANLGWFMPGKAFAKPERDQVATQAIVNVNVNF